MNRIAGVRALLMMFGWPLIVLVLVHRFPELLAEHVQIAEFSLLALTGGALVAVGFSQWRLAWSFALVLAVWGGTRLAGVPATITLLPVIALGLLPWLPERGATGPATLFVGALALIIGVLWLRGGAPAELADQALLHTVHWGDLSLPLAGLVTAALLLGLLLRLVVNGKATEMAMTGALAALVPATLLSPLSPLASLAACLAALLTLWSGILLHSWRMAYLDQLTGLPNRRALEEQLRSLPGRWSLAMLDVDHFKKFNDRFGHDVGDQVLRRVAACLAGVDERGRAYRYGGEEFSVIFPHDDLARAGDAIERLRKRVEEEPFQVREKKRTGPKQRGKKSSRTGQTITISAGLTAARNEPAAATFKRADQALYKAKAQGRNRVVVSK